MALVKKLKIFHVLVFGNVGQENICDDILERKKACVDYKKKEFKKTKTWDFSIGINPWIWSKNCIFSMFFF